MKRMLQRTLLAVALSAAAGSVAHARSWRIHHDAARKAHFTDINAACASGDVQAGDTLYLDPGCTLTASQSITKQVTVIGTGYLLNAGTFQPAAVKAALYVKTAGAKVESVEVTGTTYLCANEITLERCKLEKVTYSDTAQYATIRQCYIPNNKIQGAGATSMTTAYWTIENCIVIYTTDYDPIAQLYYPTIRNNYVRPNYSKGSASVAYMNNATVVNNIFINTQFLENANPYSMTDCIVRNNIMHCKSQESAFPDNVYIDSNTQEAVFKMEGSNDQRYELLDDSPARGAATDGGDCGPSGGLYPYVCSGYPFGMPYFERMSNPTRATNGEVKITQHVKLQTE